MTRRSFDVLRYRGAAVPLLAVLLLPLLATGCAPGGSGGDPAPNVEHQQLLDRGYAELENERPGEAEATFSTLIEALPDDPAGHANLAIARLRQQDFEGARAAIDEALRLAPESGAVAAISAEVLHWSGEEDGALAEFERAAAAEPDDLEILFRLYEQANQLRSPEAADASDRALDRLATLRPENLVLILARGRRALDDDDRATASSAFLRVGELLWQADDLAGELHAKVLAELEAGATEGARGPAQGLENVLKITPMYQQGLRELSTAIQGVPIARLSNAPPPTDFGPPGTVDFTAADLLDDDPIARGALVVADFDRDGQASLIWQREEGTLWRSDGGAEAAPLVASGLREGPTRLRTIDIDNDGSADLLRLGASSSQILLHRDGGFESEAESYLLPDASIVDAVAIDYDIEGDLDVALALDGEVQLLRNALDGALTPVGVHAFPDAPTTAPRRLLSTDFDRDGDLDLIALGAGGATPFENRRQGEFVAIDPAVRAPEGLLDGVSVDLDRDGYPDLVTLSASGVSWLRNDAGRYAAPESIPVEAGELATVVALDADADGRVDLAVGGSGGLALALQTEDGGFSSLAVAEAPPIHTLRPFDADGDGDVDLLAAGPDGLRTFIGSGAEDRSWLRIQLAGLQKGSSKNNSLGIGSSIEVRHGAAYQFHEVTSDTTHIGLGEAEQADVVRVVWTNGVPQNRLDLSADQRIVEEQLLKGSCPFVYTWDSEKIAFGTDLLWGAPIGLPVAPGVWAGADPTEIVALPMARPRDGTYDLRITEELWEAAYIDYHRLWVVDHPADVEVASNLAILSGRASDPTVRGARAPRPVFAAWDASGRDVTSRVAERDEIYADGWERSRYQGLTETPWTFTFDLGAAPTRPVRLLLEGWIFPTDASLNLAVAQRSDAAPPGTRLEVETASGWQPLVDPMAFPAGKTKTLVVDTPALPPGSRRLRIVSRLWLSWDRIRWSTSFADEAPRVVAELEPTSAELGYRGFSRMVRQAPNAPHTYDYARTSAASPWLPFPGDYTRYGDVRELLEEPDDRLVILAPGDEIRLRFDATGLPPIADGWRRTVFLESHGWDKDADRNTLIAETMEPLPFRAMRAYGSDPYPATPELDAYRRDWLTRRVE